MMCDQENFAMNNVTSNDDRKVFVGGITRDTTRADLSSCFSKFGVVEGVEIKTEPGTGRSRGFAFVIFDTPESVEAVMNAGDIYVRNRRVDAKRAIARTGKVFVGGVPQEATEDDIKACFAAFGKVVLIEAPIDKIRNQRKSYIFITFEHEESMKNLLMQPKQMLCGREVEVKTVTSRLNEQQPSKTGSLAGSGLGGSLGALGLARGGRAVPPLAAVNPLAGLSAYNWALAQQQWPGYDPITASYLGAAQAAGFGGLGLGYPNYGYNYGATAGQPAAAATSSSSTTSGANRGGLSGGSGGLGTGTGHQRYHPY